MVRRARHDAISVSYSGAELNGTNGSFVDVGLLVPDLDRICRFRSRRCASVIAVATFAVGQKAVSPNGKVRWPEAIIVSGKGFRLPLHARRAAQSGMRRDRFRAVSAMLRRQLRRRPL